MNVLDNVRLVPVIEAYTGILDAFQGGPLSERQWDAFYREKIIEAHLPAPVVAHPWLIRATDLRPESGLTTIVHGHLAAHDDADGSSLLDRLRDESTHADALNETPALPGGYLFEAGDRCLALPGCCGDLGNLGDWLAATRHEGSAHAMLWVGHPWLMVSAVGDVLTVTGPIEDPAGPGPEIGRIHRAALADAVAVATDEMKCFMGELHATCVGVVEIDDVTGLVSRLVGIHGGPASP